MLRRAGFELQRYDAEGSYPKRRQLLLEAEKVDTVLDVGAHAGEFGESLRHGGYGHRIVSFEPIGELFERLRAIAGADADWSCKKVAIGDQPGETEIHVSGNDGFSSSIREMASTHEEAAPSSSYIRSEKVTVATLDQLSEEALESASRVFLKVDTQGYESEVLAGGSATVARCRLVELELGLVELYTGQALFSDLVERMETAGFSLTDLEPGFRDQRTGQLLQVDALFRRNG
jgi:FkbM family methyltransferase